MSEIRWRETSCYVILDDTQKTLGMPQACMAVTVVDKDGKPIGTKQKTVAEAYSTARYSLDKKQLVIPVEVGPDEKFEDVYTAIKSRFNKPVMARQETIKALDNDTWREIETIEKETTK